MANAKDTEFATYEVELFEPIGPVRVRRMFGGYGMFLDGLMIGLIAADVLYLKTSEETAGVFEAGGLEPFVYFRQGKEISMSYHRAPDEALEDVEVMEWWAAMAIEAAAAAKK